MISSSKNGAVTLITLQRPERRNALNLDLCVAIEESVRVAAGDGSRAAVITGDGTSFCSGADLDGVYGDDFIKALYAMFGYLRAVPIPLVAAVNGPAIGAGTQLAMACDLRVADSRALFGVPTAKNGLAVDAWTIRVLSDLAGGGVARGIMLGCDLVGQDQSVACGLANRRGDLDAALVLADELAVMAPLTLAYNKLVLNSEPTDEAIDARIAAGWDACWDSEDLREAQQARSEKRTPVFRGR